MRNWALELQAYFTSKGTDQRALGCAVQTCDDTVLQDFLHKLPASSNEAIKHGHLLSEDLQNSDMSAEATLLRLVLLLPILVGVSPTTAQSQHAGFNKSLQELIASCRSNPALLPSLATLSSLAGDFYCALPDTDYEQEAQETARNAFRNLTKTAAAPFTADLARTLYKLGIIYRAKGDFPAALAAYEEARGIHAKLPHDHAHPHEYDLAMTLNNLSGLQNHMGNSDAAIGTIAEAVSICRKLDLASRLSCEGDLAMTLNTLGNVHFGRREYGPACTAYEEARDLYQSLAGTNPKRYEKDLALAYSNLGAVYGSTKEFQLALSAFEAALDIRKKLANAGAASAKDELAATLNNLGVLNFTQKDYSSALTAFQEAWDIRNSLTLENPAKYGSTLASLLKNLGVLQLQMGNHAAAFETQTEACDTFRALAKDSPNIYQKDLAIALSNLGNLHSGMRNYAGASAAHGEALAIRRALVDKAPDIHSFDLSTTYNNLGILYHETRQFTRARIVYEQARDIRQQLTTIDPKTYALDLAMTCNNLGVLYRILGSTELALDAFETALSIRRALTTARWQAYGADLADTLNNLASLYRETKSFEAALEVAKEVCELRAKFAEANPQSYSAVLARALSNLGLTQQAMKDFDAALEAQTQARGILLNLETDNPQSLYHDLAVVFNNLGVLHRAAQNPDAARESFETAIHHAESKIFDVDKLFLVKGQTLSAYRYMLSETCGDAAQAFALAASMRSGSTRSSLFCTDDLVAAQAVLAQMDGKTGAANIILVPTIGGKTDTLTLGLITATTCQWWALPCAGWSNLLAENPNKTDHAARQMLAREIWDELPKDLRQVIFTAITEPSEIYISGDSGWSAFPWELLRFGPGEDDYFGLHKALPRIKGIDAASLKSLVTPKSLGGGARNVAVIAPHTTNKDLLWSVISEVNILKDRIPKVGGNLTLCKMGHEATDEALRQAIRSAPAVMYYSGHGGIISNEEMLKLHSEDGEEPMPRDNIAYFGRYQLAELASETSAGSLLQNAPLIVLNSCFSGHTHGHGGQREDLVQAFLEHGAGAVIASALPMQDSLGKALSQAMFSAAAIAKPTIGAQVVEIRRQVKTSLGEGTSRQTWGGWGMVHLHGGALASSVF